MKTKPSFYLNLYNFDEPAAQGSRFILTSPRSLKACKQVGVKKCRKALENLTINHEVTSIENNSKSFQILEEKVLENPKGRGKRRNKKKDLSNDDSNLKTKQNREAGAGSEKGTAEQKQSPPKKKQQSKVLYLKGGGELTTKTSGSYFEQLSPVGSRSSRTFKRIEPTSPTGSRNIINDSLHPTSKKKLRSSTPVPDFLNDSRKSSADLSTSTGSGCALSKCCQTASRLRPQTKRISVSTILSECDRSNLFGGGLRKNGSLCFLNGIFLSEHDRRILEMMAYKKEMDRENEELAHRAHMLWEEELEAKHRHEEMEAQKWKEYIAEKRTAEAQENAKKLEEVKISLRRSKQLLEKSLEEKEFRTNRVKQILHHKKILEAEERNMQSSQRKAEVEYNQYQIEMETFMLQESWEKQRQQKLKQAEETRRSCQELYRRRVASANRIEEMRHQEKFKQVQMETEAELERLREQCRRKEEQAELKYHALLTERDRSLLQQSDVRDQKQQQVQAMYRQLDAGFKKWQEQVSELQREASERASLRVAKDIIEKKERVASENKTRVEHHNAMMRRVAEEEQARSEYLKEMTRRKEAKMGRLQREREMSLKESRMQAQTTAHLREHIRRTLSPETFDRKVARVALELRIAGRPPTASPTMTRSHILLG